MSNVCTICNRSDRAEIEAEILALSPGSAKGERFSIESIADRYNLDVEELKAHALFHTPVVGEEDLSSGEPSEHGRDSLTRKVHLREADLLAEMSNEYLATLKNMGRRINSLINADVNGGLADEEKQIRTAKLLTKPMVELYLGLGGEIRSNVKIMADLDRQLNGPQDNLGSGLSALAAAINGSGQ